MINRWLNLLSMLLDPILLEPAVTGVFCYTISDPFVSLLCSHLYVISFYWISWLLIEFLSWCRTCIINKVAGFFFFNCSCKPGFEILNEVLCISCELWPLRNVRLEIVMLNEILHYLHWSLESSILSGECEENHKRIYIAFDILQGISSYYSKEA